MKHYCINKDLLRKYTYFPASFRCRTIALETGFQNSQLCSTIVQLSFSPAELNIMFAFPLIYSIFQLVVAVLSVGSELSRADTSADMDGNFVSIVCRKVTKHLCQKIYKQQKSWDAP